MCLHVEMKVSGVIAVVACMKLEQGPPGCVESLQFLEVNDPIHCEEADQIEVSLL